MHACCKWDLSKQFVDNQYGSTRLDPSFRERDAGSDAPCETVCAGARHHAGGLCSSPTRGVRSTMQYVVAATAHWAFEWFPAGPGASSQCHCVVICADRICAVRDVETEGRVVELLFSAGLLQPNAQP